MAKAAGIDLGTTTSVIAVWKDGGATVVRHARGARTEPPVAGFTDTDTDTGDADAVERRSGPPARRQAVPDPEGAGTSAAAPVLRQLAEDAGRALGERITEAVITVPAHYDDARRTAVGDACRTAGLDVLRVIDEPTAAALAYGMDKIGRATNGFGHGTDEKEHESVLVFDLGGGTLDVSVLDVADGAVEVRSTAGDSHLGGADFDRRLVDHLADGFQRDNGIDPRADPRSLPRLFEAAEKAKTELSSATRTRIGLPFVAADISGPRHLTGTVTRPTFERLTADLVERCAGPVRRALADAALTEQDIDEVVLVGGSTRIPAVRALVRRLAGGTEPRTGVSPDEVVALGAAIQAGVLAGRAGDALPPDVLPLALGVETHGGVMTKIIERNTPFPVRRSRTFSTAEDNQSAVDVVAVQGERERAADNRVLGRFQLTGIRPAPRGEPRIEVTFDVDADGVLHVGARDRATGGAQSVSIGEGARLDRSEAERIVAEAARNHGEDQALREAVHARNELDAAAHRVEHLLTELGDFAPEHERARARLLVSDARQAVEVEADPVRAGTLTSELHQTHVSLAAHRTPPAADESGDVVPGDGPGDAGAGEGLEPSGADDVIDAEFDRD
ncbi:Hsp70 family protein [Streptomyces sp. NBC_01498]|uniref:Hsp70 family protein n=1 Tax=Streptomyces sp. NBC_01498 TaxID=2975870 RepID=UPI002E7B8A48|nr:Hsp70 family protein [Streptomyces sp. NBC_01498]WTL23369.1 Hsp70 family protein [Streptomyces sp. NBC_01498]